MEVDLLKTFLYEKNNPIDWENGKFIICNFPLEINAKAIGAIAKEMSSLDFFIRKEHKFLRNILNESRLRDFAPLESLSSYYNAFTKFLKIRIFLEGRFGNLSKFEEINDENLLEFCQNDCYAHDNFTELLDEIKKIGNKKNT